MVAARAGLALASFAVAAAMVLACEGTPDLAFDGDDASTATDATLPDGAVPVADANGSHDGASGHDSSVPDTSTVADSNPPPDSTPPPDANTCNLDGSPPTGAGCCGLEPCVGVGCNHCHECALADCGAAMWCCAKVNGGGQFKSEQCAMNPADPGMCPQ